MIILENTKEYKDTKLTLPVGIGVVQTEAVKNFYNTSDADATSDDIVKDKIAYGKYGKLTGTLDLDAEKEISYQDGYETGKVDGYDSGYSIGYDGGYIAGETAGYNDGYAEGLDDGITDGRNQIIEEQSDANIKANDVTKGKIGYGANNEKIVGTSEAITSIDVAASGIRFAYSTFSEIPSYYDFSNVTTMDHMFYYCAKLTDAPLIDTSNATGMQYMYYGCSNLTAVGFFDTSNATDMQYMFTNCSNLTSVALLDTSKSTDMSYMFNGCSKLTSIPQFDTSKSTTVHQMLSNCQNLTSVPEFDLSGMTGINYDCTRIFGTSNYVIDFGGFKDLGKSYAASWNAYRDLQLQSQAKLSYQSCMNVINKVYDVTLLPNYTYTPKIRFHATPYALLSANDIAIATAKGWAVQVG